MFHWCRKSSFLNRKQNCPIPRSLQKANSGRARGGIQGHLDFLPSESCGPCPAAPQSSCHLGGGARAVSPWTGGSSRLCAWVDNVRSVLHNPPLSPASLVNLGLADISSKTNRVWCHLIKAFWEFLRTPEFPEEPHCLVPPAALPAHSPHRASLL